MNTLRQRSLRPVMGLVTRSNHFLLIAAASLLVLFAVQPKSARAQGDCADCDISSNATPQSVGTNFLLCFERNYDTLNLVEDSGYCEVFVASLTQPATVVITCKHFPSLNDTIILPANSSQTVRLTDIQNQAFHNLWINTMDSIATNRAVNDRVVHVTSDNPIVCSGLDYKYLTADAVMAFPESSSATDYRIMSYQNSTNSTLAPSDFCPSQFAVAAFNDNTTVTITPNAPTAAGHAAGAPFTVTLNAGECIQVQTDPNISGLDLTGSSVSSSGGVIAVYAGNARTEIPAGYIDFVNTTSRDMLLETMPPTSTWGSSFVLDAIDTSDGSGQQAKRAEGDNVRVLALNDNTSVTVNGNPWITLNHNQFADTAITQAWLIQGSGPLLVGEMAHSAATDPGIGDPFLAIVPPLDQSYNNFTFLAYPDPAFELNKVIIATDNSAKSTISYDGNIIPTSSPYEPVSGTVNGESYSILELAVNPGAHTITSSAPSVHGFTILSYGLGDVVSYGYTGGSLLVPQRAIQIDYPPTTIGAKHSNVVNFRNTCYMPDYLDSAIFVPTNPKNQVFGIHTVEDVATDIDRLDIGASAQIHFVADGPLGSPVSGTVKIYCHTPAQFNLQDAEMPFTLWPDAADAGVNTGEATQLGATASPNPFSTYTMLNFSMPAPGDVSIIIYNDLGKVVQNIASGEFPAGPYSIRIDKRELTDGHYTCVISSSQLNFKERIALIVSE